MHKNKEHQKKMSTKNMVGLFFVFGSVWHDTISHLKYLNLFVIVSLLTLLILIFVLGKALAI